MEKMSNLIQLIELLSNDKISLNYKDKENNTLLMLAIKEKKLEIIKQLLDLKISTKTLNNSFESPLDLAIKSNNLDIIKALLENDVKIDYDTFTKIINSKNTEIVKLILTFNPLINEEILTKAISFYNFEDIKGILDFSKVNDVIKYCKIVLATNNEEMIDYMLKKSNINQKTLYELLYDYIYSSNTNISILLKYINPSYVLDDKCSFLDEIITFDKKHININILESLFVNKQFNNVQLYDLLYKYAFEKENTYDGIISLILGNVNFKHILPSYNKLLIDTIHTPVSINPKIFKFMLQKIYLDENIYTILKNLLYDDNPKSDKCISIILEDFNPVDFKHSSIVLSSIVEYIESQFHNHTFDRTINIKIIDFLSKNKHFSCSECKPLLNNLIMVTLCMCGYTRPNHKVVTKENFSIVKKILSNFETFSLGHNQHTIVLKFHNYIQYNHHTQRTIVSNLHNYIEYMCSEMFDVIEILIRFNTFSQMDLYHILNKICSSDYKFKQILSEFNIISMILKYINTPLHEILYNITYEINYYKDMFFAYDICNGIFLKHPINNEVIKFILETSDLRVIQNVISRQQNFKHKIEKHNVLLLAITTKNVDYKRDVLYKYYAIKENDDFKILTSIDEDLIQKLIEIKEFDVIEELYNIYSVVLTHKNYKFLYDSGGQRQYQLIRKIYEKSYKSMIKIDKLNVLNLAIIYKHDKLVNFILKENILDENILLGDDIYYNIIANAFDTFDQDIICNIINAYGNIVIFNDNNRSNQLILFEKIKKSNLLVQMLNKQIICDADSEYGVCFKFNDGKTNKNKNISLNKLLIESFFEKIDVELFRWIANAHDFDKEKTLKHLLLSHDGSHNSNKTDNELIIICLLSKLETKIHNTTKLTYPMFHLNQSRNYYSIEQYNDVVEEIHIAILHYSTDTVLSFLKVGSNPEELTENGISSLLLAIYAENINSVSLLIEYNVDVNKVCESKCFGQMNALTMACLTKNIKIIKYLLEHKANPNIQLSISPLMIACIYNDIKIIDLLIEYGASIENPARDSLELINHAIINDNLDVFKILLKHMCNVQKVNNCLYHLCINMDTSTSTSTSISTSTYTYNKSQYGILLIENGADINYRRKDKSIIELILEKSNKSKLNEFEITLLSYCLENNKIFPDLMEKYKNLLKIIIDKQTLFNKIKEIKKLNKLTNVMFDITNIYNSLDWEKCVTHPTDNIYEYKECKECKEQLDYCIGIVKEKMCNCHLCLKCFDKLITRNMTISHSFFKYRYNIKNVCYCNKKIDKILLIL